jgi:hypothetical protein
MLQSEKASRQKLENDVWHDRLQDPMALEFPNGHYLNSHSSLLLFFSGQSVDEIQ